MFSSAPRDPFSRQVSALSRRDKESLLHTHADLRGVPWLLDRNGRLDPATTCDREYLESAFNHDQAYFLKTIGAVNCAEMHQKLVAGPRRWQKDDEFYLTLSDTAGRWFQKKIPELTIEMKSRLIPYIFRCYRTSPSQLARCLRLEMSQVEEILSHAAQTRFR